MSSSSSSSSSSLPATSKSKMAAASSAAAHFSASTDVASAVLRSKEQDEKEEPQKECISQDRMNEEMNDEEEKNTRTKEFQGHSCRPRRHHNRPRNPFSERQRNNFPNWGDVFTDPTATTATRKTTTKTTTVVKKTTAGSCAGSDAGVSSSSSSSSSIASMSILNMSIGARAALNEHLRHVHKYGIDGERRTWVDRDNDSCGSNGRNADHNNNSDSENDIGIPAPPPPPITTRATTKTTIQSSLDHHWESLLDPSFQVNTSTGPGSSISINSSSSQGGAGAEIAGGAGTGRTTDISSHQHQQHQYHSFLYNSSSNENSVEEIMTDVSNDFFNSSRVEELMTPERNKARQVEVIVARGNNNVSVLESSIEEEAALEEEEALDGSAFQRDDVDAGFYNFLHQLPPLVTRGGPDSTTSLHSSSFHNFGGDETSAVDLSRISSNFGSDHGGVGGGGRSSGPQTPLPSFDEDGGAGGHPLRLDEHAFSPIRSVSSPFRIDTNNNNTSGHDSSSLSSSEPYRKMPSFPATMGASDLSPYSQQQDKSSHSPQQQIVEGLHHQQPSSGWLGQSQNFVPQSNVSTPGDKNASSASASSSLHSTISSMIDEASSFVNYVTQEVELSMEAIESLPHDFFKAMDIGGGGGTQNHGEMDNNSTPSPISPVGSRSSTNSSSPESKSHHLPTQSKRPTVYGRERGLSGRRRYRTVVPRRVYIGPSPSEDDECEGRDGQQNQQPELHVSFDIQSNPETSRTNRSLLESFEEVIHTTF
mmetsp:Transcript_5528/g.13317  ORF Transcript_5528/g.13317 Transcript_5528/m.13317 type:complete len:761 (+) Transcript_5528:47-2329(+)